MFITNSTHKLVPYALPNGMQQLQYDWLGH